MQKGDLIFMFTFLIALYLVVAHGEQANAIMRTVLGGTAHLTKTLQGR